MQDGNAGLLKQALAARQMRHTQRLTQTYLTLSLADIARHVGLPSPQEAEEHILRQAASLLAQLQKYSDCDIQQSTGSRTCPDVPVPNCHGLTHLTHISLRPGLACLQMA